MNAPPGMKLMFQGKTEFMREIAKVLADAGIRHTTGPLPGSAWGPQAWLAVASEQEAEAKAAYERHMDRMVQRSGQKHVDHAIDLEAPENACPACGARFQTAGTTHCPDCGLRFS